MCVRARSPGAHCRLRCPPDVYGGLSGQSVSDVDVNSLIFQGKKVEGFWLSPYLLGKNMLGQLSLINRTVAALKTDLRTGFRTVYPLHQVPEALHDYLQNMSGGKILISSLVSEAMPAADIIKAQAEAAAAAAAAAAAPQPAAPAAEAPAAAAPVAAEGADAKPASAAAPEAPAS